MAGLARSLARRNSDLYGRPSQGSGAVSWKFDLLRALIARFFGAKMSAKVDSAFPPSSAAVEPSIVAEASLSQVEESGSMCRGRLTK